jgi:outer membrane protein OmpA-like peptidoglycan-associated protein
MKRSYTLFAVVALAAGAQPGCASGRAEPKTLVDAREDFIRTRDGIASRFDPTDLHEAEVALERAEQAWRESPDDPSTADVAIIADRKALIAQAQADAMRAEQDAQQATTQLQALRAAQLQSTESQLGRTQMQLDQKAALAARQAQQLKDLEANLKDARATIARIASVKDDDRGMVITLQGEVLFKTGKSDLKPAAMAKLDQIAEALKGKEQPVVVYGYTDSVGTRDTNLTLSQNRAHSVRDYLVSKGVPQDLVTAQGKGPDEPVADNSSLEGRAQNRRVEIVVQPKK